VAKKSMIARELKKVKLIARYAKKRQSLKEQINKASDYEAILEAQEKLQKLPTNSNANRHTKRCHQCGRPHAVYKKFGLCRICLRNELMKGNVPGGRKSSW
jgi:small subunit ribosomal protein S14